MVESISGTLAPALSWGFPRRRLSVSPFLTGERGESFLSPAQARSPVSRYPKTPASKAGATFLRGYADGMLRPDLLIY